MAIRTAPGTDGGHGGTDLGRRIREHRDRAGLSRQEAASRAGMAQSYLSYLETDPDASPSPATLALLASALGTTSRSLAGAGMGVAPGRQPPVPRAVAESLTAAECRAYLGDGGVGRLVYTEERGPVALPVNYRMLGDDVVFRTGAGDAMTRATAQERVSFEVDHLDDALGEGWSVLLTGRLHQVTGGDELVAVTSLGVTPWPGGERQIYLRFITGEATGRRIRAG